MLRTVSKMDGKPAAFVENHFMSNLTLLGPEFLHDFGLIYKILPLPNSAQNLRLAMLGYRMDHH